MNGDEVDGGVGTCGTCQHWRPPTQRNDFFTPVRFRDDVWDDDAEDGFGGDKVGSAANRLYGECLLLDLGDDLPLDQPPPLAVLMDGSNYHATLYSQADFGCALHTPATTPEGASL